MRYETSNFIVKEVVGNMIKASGECCMALVYGEDITKIFRIKNDGSSYYLVDGERNGLIDVERGKSYIFDINSPGHPFMVLTSGTFDANSSGYTNFPQLSETKSILFTVENDTPDILYYFCQNHPTAMSGTINMDGYRSSGWVDPGSGSSSGNGSSSGASTQWQPTDILSEYGSQGFYPKLWLDADDASTLSLSNNTVSSWTDKINNVVFSVNNSAYYPNYILNALNSKPIIGNLNTSNRKILHGAFDQSDRILSNHIFYTFIVIKNLQNGDVLLDMTGNSSTRIYNINLDTALFEGSTGIDDYDDSYSTGFVTVDTTGDILMVSYQGSQFNSVDGRRNRSHIKTQINANTTSIKNSMLSTSIQNSDYLETLYLLDISSPITEQATRVYGIAEIIQVAIDENEDIYATEVAGGDSASYTYFGNSGLKQKIEGYLAHKWGTTAKLPSTHPYKNQPPQKQ